MASFEFFLKDKMINLGLIKFQMGLPLNINVNDEQNKFEVNIPKHKSKIANFQRKYL